MLKTFAQKSRAKHVDEIDDIEKSALIMESIWVGEVSLNLINHPWDIRIQLVTFEEYTIEDGHLNITFVQWCVRLQIESNNDTFFNLHINSVFNLNNICLDLHKWLITCWAKYLNYVLCYQIGDTLLQNNLKIDYLSLSFFIVKNYLVEDKSSNYFNFWFLIISLKLHFSWHVNAFLTVHNTATQQAVCLWIRNLNQDKTGVYKIFYMQHRIF